MKKCLVLLAIMVLCSSIAYASVGVQDDDTYLGEAALLNVEGVGTSFNGNIVTIDFADLESSTTIAAGETLTVDNLTTSANVMTILGITLTESGGVLYASGRAVS